MIRKQLIRSEEKKKASKPLTRVDISEEDVAMYERRDCYDGIKNYLTEGHFGLTIAAIAGFKGTGKTVLLKQLALSFGVDHIFVVEEGQTINDVYFELDRQFWELGNCRVFIDDITNAVDFVSNSKILSDCFPSIVVTGNPVGIAMAERDRLLFSTYHVNLDYLSFAEYKRLMKSDSIDTYIRSFGLGYCISGGTDEISRRQAREYFDEAVLKVIYSELQRPKEYYLFQSRNWMFSKLNILSLEELRQLIDGFVRIVLAATGASASRQDAVLAQRYTYLDGMNSVEIRELAQPRLETWNKRLKLVKEVTLDQFTQLGELLWSIGLLGFIKTRRFKKEDGSWKCVGSGEECIFVPTAIKYYQLLDDGFPDAFTQVLKDAVIYDIVKPLYPGRVSSSERGKNT